MLQTLEGTVERVTYESADGAFRVVRFAVEGRSQPLSVVGALPRVAPGARWRVRGVLVHDPRYGEQLKAEVVTELAPATLAGLLRYLGSGLIKGVGEASAKRIVDAFGLDTLRVLDETPERLHEVEGLGAKRVAAIGRVWQEQSAVREVMVFLQAHGASPALAARIFRRYGADAMTVVARDPYRLAMDVWGVGFKTADRIASSLGIAPDSPVRIQAGVLQAVHDSTQAGHTYVDDPDLRDAAAALLGLERFDASVGVGFRDAVRALGDGGHVVTEGRSVYPSAVHAAEVRLATRFAEAAREEGPALVGAEAAVAAFETSSGVELAAQQREAIRIAAQSRAMVITGGPGVGKTTLVRALLALFDASGLRVALAAPTGRAAKRITESTGREATTLHRLLEFDPKTTRFRRGAHNPVEVDAVVVDEASMLDLPLADALAAAVRRGARLVLVGDVDQLPSVGVGAVLRDLIASRTVPCVRLTEIFRQAAGSFIVRNAHAIQRGEAPQSSPPDSPQADFFVVDRRDPAAAQATVVELVSQRIPRRFGLDPMADVQVLTPVHRGLAGAVALNGALQDVLNPPERNGARVAHVSRGERSFRVGDKVMQLRNDYDRNVWNGDLGFVTRIDPDDGQLFVGYDPRKEEGQGRFDREAVYDVSALDELSLAYACTVHKAQGSEYPAVVIPLQTSHFVMLTKNLLYTAVTRARRLVVLVSDPKALSLALADDRNDARRTGLARRLADAQTLSSGPAMKRFSSPGRTLLMAATSGALAFVVGSWVRPAGPPSHWLSALALMGYGGVLLAGVLNLRLRMFVDAVVHLPPGAVGVALTFDDGPDPDTTPHVLAALAHRGAQATFFVIGRKVERHPELTRAILAQGHTLGLHGYEHDRFFSLRREVSVRRDLLRGLEVLQRTCGTRPTLFRPPIGHTNPVLARVVGEFGLTTVAWSVSGRDGTRHARATHVLARVRRGLAPGAILLLHDAAERGDFPPTALDVLPALLAELAERRLPTVSLVETLMGTGPREAR